MASLVQQGKYGVINTADTTTNWFYVNKFLSEAYTLQNNTKIDGQIISAGELVVKAQYLCPIQENTNWYWRQQPLQQNIIVPKRTILHPRPDVVRITDFKTSIILFVTELNKKSTQRHPICLTDADYDYILDEIERW